MFNVLLTESGHQWMNFTYLIFFYNKLFQVFVKIDVVSYSWVGLALNFMENINLQDKIISARLAELGLMITATLSTVTYFTSFQEN